jgi:uncharacterized protein
MRDGKSRLQSPFDFGQSERRTFTLDHAKARLARTGGKGLADGKLQVVGHAAVYNRPSVEMSSHKGSFIEHIAPNAFDKVLRSRPDVLLTWDHETSLVLARTYAGTLELSSDPHGLRFYARMSDTSYARDLQTLMNDGVVTQSSFLFTVAPGGEEWRIDSAGGVERTITEVGGLYDVCICAAGAYPATDSGLVRSLAVQYALDRGFLTQDPEVAGRVARAKAELDIQRRRVAI